VVSDDETCDFPAESSFEVFVQVTSDQLPFPLINLDPINLTGTVNSLPPLFDTYNHPPQPTSLVQKGTTGPMVGTVKGESNHRPEQEPTLSVKAGGPTGLDPAALHDFGNPPSAGLTRAGLGLVATDDIDAVSYGLDIIDSPDELDGGAMSIAFSVDKDAVGQPNTGVNREATKAGGHEAEGDEFVATFNGSNLELVDEQAVTLAPGNVDGDDLDALTNEPTGYADLDQDLDADRPVFFSLAPGSATLAGFPANENSAATIFYSLNGVVDVYAAPAAIGLEVGDDLDALCLMKSGLPSSVKVRSGPAPPGIPAAGGASQFDVALFSLAKGSPTLTTLGGAPGDLFVTNFSSAHTPAPPALFATAAQIGLLDNDELNAVKCLMSVAIIPIYGIPTEAGTVLVNVGGNDAIAQPDDDQYDSEVYGIWSIINPGIDFHGPYIHPDSPLAGALNIPLLDPRTVPFGAGIFDVCPLFHLHTSSCGGGTDFQFEDHNDPAPCICGHGMFVPHRGPAIPIVPGLEPFFVGLSMVQSFNSLREQFPELYRSATLHRIGLAFLLNYLGILGDSAPPAAASLVANSSDVARLAAAGSDDAYLVILIGTGRTTMDLTVDGANGLTVGPVLSSIPVPEPSGLISGLSALAVLAGLRRFRNPNRVNTP
jgi:hypothetical protein